MNEEDFNKLAAKLFAGRDEERNKASDEELLACFIRSKREAINRFAKKYEFPMEKCRALFAEIASDLAGESLPTTERKITMQERNKMAYEYLAMAGVQEEVDVSLLGENELFELGYKAFLELFEEKMAFQAKKFGVSEKESREFTVKYLRIISQEE